jgi:hypothetical protein
MLDVRSLAGSPFTLENAAARFIPGKPGVGVGLELRETAIQLGLQLVGDGNGFGQGGNAVPEKLDESKALVNRQLQELSDRYVFHGHEPSMDILAIDLSG